MAYWVQILQAKIQRLEKLIQLKDIRIEDLDTRLRLQTHGGDMTVAETHIPSGTGGVTHAVRR